MTGQRLTTTDVALLLRCSVSFVHTIPARELPYETVGRHRRYQEPDVRFYMQKQRHTGEVSGV